MCSFHPAFADELFGDGFYFQDNEGNFRKLNAMLHVTLYALLAIHAIIDLVTHYRGPMLPDANYLSFAVAFLWFGMGIYFHGHMHSKEPLESVVHVLPVPLILAMGVTALLEMSWKRGVATTLVRTYFVLTLGTWFLHMAFMLYGYTTFPGRLELIVFE